MCSHSHDHGTLIVLWCAYSSVQQPMRSLTVSVFPKKKKNDRLRNVCYYVFESGHVQKQPSRLILGTSQFPPWREALTIKAGECAEELWLFGLFLDRGCFSVSSNCSSLLFDRPFSTLRKRGFKILVKMSKSKFVDRWNRSAWSSSWTTDESSWNLMTQAGCCDMSMGLAFPFPVSSSLH